MKNSLIETFNQNAWTKENFDFLQDFIPANEGSLACFDFDNTLIKNDLGERVMLSLLDDGLEHFQGLFSSYFKEPKVADSFYKDRFKNPKAFTSFVFSEYERIRIEEGLERAYRWTSFIFSGWKEEDFRLYVKKVWDEQKELPKSEAALPFLEMKELIAFLLENSWDIYVLTASPEQAIQEAVYDFGISPQKVIGMRLVSNLEGDSTPGISEPYTYGKGKVEAIKKFIKKVPCLAFGDSINDFPMLTYARKAVLFDRGDENLKTECKKAGIYIQKPFY
ncbi:MAG: haloacid dehalogenase-like hydrolase [Leptospiraceae bacterium]|nr:haloacid dehalogenase-like hydrolase [Leptospiraceae bacterium]MCP5500914.1 haloacid dehalogenase-like hydrolase [Leptospiraceae bacterium]